MYCLITIITVIVCFSSFALLFKPIVLSNAKVILYSLNLPLCIPLVFDFIKCKC